MATGRSGSKPRGKSPRRAKTSERPKLPILRETPLAEAEIPPSASPEPVVPTIAPPAGALEPPPSPAIERPRPDPVYLAPGPVHVRETELPPLPEYPSFSNMEALPPAPIMSNPDPIRVTGSPAASQPADTSVGEVPPLLFEIAWEVCWQLGGIYTVLKSKAETMLRKWGERYILVGPYHPQSAAIEFEQRPADGAVAIAIESLREQGITAYHGRWLIPGRPRVILIDYRGRLPRLGADKYLLWKDHGITAPDQDTEVNDVIAFGFAVTELLRHVKAASPTRPILAHFHEWMAGVAVPRIAHERIDVATVFTTHATLLGRYLASDNPYFYDHLPFFDADAMAKKYLIFARFQIERAAAHASSVFTTVSEVTGFEAEKLLGRKPDLILPNGLNIKRFAALHEFQNLHREYKEKIHEFVMGHFFPAYNFDLDNTLYIFTSGRYEYRNKGIDLFIEALHRLNQRLRWMPQRPTVIAFIVTKAETKNINVSALQSHSMYEELKDTCSQISARIEKRLVDAAVQGRLPMPSDLIDEDERVRLKQGIYALRTGRQPPIVTHDLVHDATDPILQHLRHRQLFNAADDPVKIIFHPQFMSATSPLMSLDYEQFVRGCHMGVFPSYYEPWGYTPMESVALGVPAVTTDLSGFGAYVLSHIDEANDQGIKVLTRRQRSFEDTTNDLVDHLVQFAILNRRQRIENRNKVERLGERFDWSALISCYNDAHALALTRSGLPAPKGNVEVRMV